MGLLVKAVRLFVNVKMGAVVTRSPAIALSLATTLLFGKV
jgi:hypothetical protein